MTTVGEVFSYALDICCDDVYSDDLVEDIKQDIYLKMVIIDRISEIKYDNFRSLYGVKHDKILHLKNRKCVFINSPYHNQDIRCLGDDLDRLDDEDHVTLNDPYYVALKKCYGSENPNDERGINVKNWRQIMAPVLLSRFEYTFGNNPTIYEFIQCIWKIKSSRCDTWYELFSDVTIVDDGDILELQIEFGHGS